MQLELIGQLLAIAASQHGMFSSRQAAALGVTPSMLRNAIAHGWIRVVRRGIYAVAGAPASRWQPLYAAAIAAGPAAAISHSSAASVHSLFGIAEDGIELSVPWQVRRRLQGVRIHRSRTLVPEDLLTRHGMQVTTPIRTVIDLSGRFGDPLLGRIVDEGSISRVWTPETIRSRLDQFDHPAAGHLNLGQLLALRLGEGNPDSYQEQRVIRVVKDRYPGYVLHHRVVIDGEVFEMDISWLPEKIDGEVDGMNTRVLSRSKFEQTCHRANVLAAHGWRIVHFTAQMDEQAILAQLAPFFQRY